MELVVQYANLEYPNVVLRKAPEENWGDMDAWIANGTHVSGVPYDSQWVLVTLSDLQQGYIKKKHLKPQKHADKSTFRVNVPNAVCLRNKMEEKHSKCGPWVPANEVVHGHHIDDIWTHVIVPNIGNGYIKSKYLDFLAADEKKAAHKNARDPRR